MKDNKEARKQLFVQALRNRGTVCAFIGDYDSALKDYERLITFYKSYKGDNFEKKLSLLNYAFYLSKGRNEYKRSKKIITDVILGMNKKDGTIYPKANNTMGAIYWRTGEYDKALEYFNEALIVYRDNHNWQGLSGVLNNIALVYWHEGNLEKAIECSKEALDISKKMGDKRRVSVSLSNIGLFYQDKGDIKKSLEYYLKSLEISNEIGDIWNLSTLYNSIGMSYEYMGRFNEALKYYEKGLHISEEMGEKLGIAIVYGNSGTIYQIKGELSKALEHYYEYFKLSKEIGYRRGMGIALKSIASIYIEKDNPEKSKKYLKKAERIHKEIGDKVHIAEDYSFISETYIQKGDYKTARRFARKALEIADETGGKEMKILALRSLGKSLYLGYTQGAENSDYNLKNVIVYLKQAIALAKETKLVFELGVSLYEIGRILLITKGGRNKYINEAVEIFKRLGAKLWLKRIDQL